MAKKRPTAEQARLLRQLHSVRLEARMREAREWFLKNYHPENLDEANRLTPPGSEESAYARMVTSYWDQACALLNYGLLPEHLFFGANAELFAVFRQIRPILPEARERYAYARYLEHLDKAARRCEKWMKRRPPLMPEQRRKQQARQRTSTRVERQDGSNGNVS